MFVYILLRAGTLRLCPFPEGESGITVLVHVPFKDVRRLIGTGQFLGCCLPVDCTSKTHSRTPPCKLSQSCTSKKSRVAVPGHEHTLAGVLAIQPTVRSEHRPIG